MASHARTVTWLHLSDIHFTARRDSYDRRVVLTALADAAKELCNKGRRPDLVFFTGDLANFGKEDEYAEASAFFDSLLGAVELPRERLFVVPGNHDVDRTAAPDLVRTLETVAESDKFFDPDREPARHFLRLAAFRQWHDDYFASARTQSRSASHASSMRPIVVTVRGLHVAVLPINSALFAFDSQDHGKLWIGRRALCEATAEIDRVKAGRPRPDIAVALLHHPLDWLHDAERAQIKAELRRSVDFVLRGHLHENDFEAVVYPGSRTGAFHMASGASYPHPEHPEYPKRCLYVTLDFDSGRVTVYPICYFASPESRWVLDPSVFPNEREYEATYFVPWKRAGGAKLPRSFGASGVQDKPKEGEAIEIAGVRFIFLAGGDFTMGAAVDDGDAFRWEKPAHPVKMPSFWIGEAPITRSQFARFLAEAEYRRPRYWRDVGPEDADHPVVCENTDDIEAFCRWLTGRAQRILDLSGPGVQITSEAEWEYSARGTDGRRYPWVGNDVGPPGERANFDSDTMRSVYAHPKGATPQGVLDMAGNVFERCRDRVGRTMWRYAWADGLVVDPVGRRGDQMALRSCDHRMPANYLRATWRVGNEPLLWRYTMKLPFDGLFARGAASLIARVSSWHEAAVWTTVAKVGFRCTFRVYGVT